MHPAKSIFEAAVRTLTEVTSKGKTVTVYSGILPENAESPYIYMDSVDCTRTDDKTNETWKCDLNIKTITMATGNGGTESEAMDIEEQLFKKLEQINCEGYSETVVNITSSMTLKEYVDGTFYGGRTLNVNIEITKN